MLVIGGSLERNPLSNRLCEDAVELVPCLDKVYHTAYLSAIQSGDLATIGKMLQQLHSVNINIVGSRGFVYSSLRLSELIICVRNGAFVNMNSFPCTVGLRKAIINASEK